MPDGWRPILLELELSRGGSRLNPLAHVVGRAQTQQEQPQRCMRVAQGGSGVHVRYAQSCTRAFSRRLSRVNPVHVDHVACV